MPSVNNMDNPWDILCDMNDAEIQVDGDLFYQNGKSVFNIIA